MVGSAVGKIALIVKMANERFVGRSDAIYGLALGLVSGSHLIMLGAPGTGKSALSRFFCDQAGLTFFRKLLNPDTTRDELVGVIDPMSIQQGKWDRRWQGLAECDIAFLDEMGKAGSQVQNMLLDAMEERKVTGSVDRDIPLHMVISASNEPISDESPALWDRFTIRILVKDVSTLADFKKMLLANTKAKVFNAVGISKDEITALKQEVRNRVSVVDNDVIDALSELWAAIGSSFQNTPSSRRFWRVLELAAADSILMGFDRIRVKNLQVAKYVLWESEDQIERVKEIVNFVCDKSIAKLEMFNRALNEIMSEDPDTLAGRSKLRVKINKLRKLITEDQDVDTNDTYPILDKLTAKYAMIEEF